MAKSKMIPQGPTSTQQFECIESCFIDHIFFSRGVIYKMAVVQGKSKQYKPYFEAIGEPTVSRKAVPDDPPKPVGGTGTNMEKGTEQSGGDKV